MVLVRAKGHEVRILRTFRDSLMLLITCSGGRVAEEVEVGSAEHLAFDHFDLVDGAFDRAGAVGQG